MKAVLMDGRAVAGQIKERLKNQVQMIKKQGIEPRLATILVGDDPASRTYVGNKHKAAEEVGIRSENHKLTSDVEESALAQLIADLNSDARIHGVLLQLPLPSHLNPLSIIERISPQKDVDGLTSANMGKLFYGQATLIPCTPKGIMALLHHYNVQIGSSHAVIINRSSLVGKPLYHLLLAENATVTTCHSKSRDLSEITRQADIIVTAVGRRPQFVVTSSMVKEGAVVIDVAMNRVNDRWVGDVDFEAVSEKASFITPVPGGVGPMTVVMLLENTLRATVEQMKIHS
jgi:methylenetetrahydrofolate dehydrogenase (NADP+)/methenyltetrahydrofolate cyclohydrolase